MNTIERNYRLSNEETYDFFTTTWNAQINDKGNGLKRSQFKVIIKTLIRDFVISGIRINDNIKIFVNFKNIKRSEFYILAANVFRRFFSGKITQEYFILLGESIFNCNGKAHKTLYNNITNHINDEVPERYKNLF